MFDPMGLIVVAVVLAHAATAGLHHLFGWIGVAALVVSCQITRLRVLHHDPTVLRVTTYWVIVPVLWKRVPLRDVTSYSDDSHDGPTDDRLQIGNRDLPCGDAGRWVAWLKESIVAVARISKERS